MGGEGAHVAKFGVGGDLRPLTQRVDHAPDMGSSQLAVIGQIVLKGALLSKVHNCKECRTASAAQRIVE